MILYLDTSALVKLYVDEPGRPAVSGQVDAAVAVATVRVTYAEARAKFLRAAKDAGLAVQSHPHPLPGHDAETLAMDVARDGSADAPAVLVLSSGCHGVEGFCGSGAQGAVLADAPLRARARDAGVHLGLDARRDRLGAPAVVALDALKASTRFATDTQRRIQTFSSPERLRYVGLV